MTTPADLRDARPDLLRLAQELGDIALPESFPSPFDQLGPHPVAERAARLLQAELPHEPGEGKMYGVLVVRTLGGELGFLSAFSGTLGGRFDVPGFVPPIFERTTRDAIEVPGEKLVKRLTLRAREYAASEEATFPLRRREELEREQEDAIAELRERHAQNRRERAEQRAGADAALLHELAQKSRRDKAERRAVEASHAEAMDVVLVMLRRVERRLASHAQLQRRVSRRLMRQIHDTYVLTSVRGETARLRALFPEAEPPGGAGDCAAPKLLSYAVANDLKPIALAEFWWGPPPPGGGRVSGAFYPSCQVKCGPVLPFLLDGIRVSPAREFSPPDATHLDLEILHEDERIVVVNKPAGLLSVPSRRGIDDHALARLQSRYPGAMLTHRLDLDTSGVLVAARDAKSYAALQRQFLRRSVAKRYVAIVDGDIDSDEGEIDLAIRVDVTDRPRHIHDPVHGRRAFTKWRVLERLADGRTRVAFFPLTGRTHQLRVHASHPLGLGAPIVGDRLYGREGARLLLHAERIEIDHPDGGRRVAFESPAPF